ncbi:MAG: DUF3458 domain-containing protein, partial [Pseudomonadota bacterium]
LKEGFTVYRDQEFSADTRSRAVQRISQVRALRAGQFPEDAGPLAHPVRPSAYKEINNFYTATVYQKGAELVRMLATIVGPQHFRAATDRYFERHDGEAAVMEDFVECFEAVTGRDLSQFMLWYAQAGTPYVIVKDEWDAKERTLTLTISQSTPATPGQETKRPVPIPVRIGLLDGQGGDMPLISESGSVSGDVILLTEATTQVVFSGVAEKPVLSLLRKFSAPVIVQHEEDEAAVLHRARHDSDLFNRWQALNTAATDAMVNRYHNTPNADAEAHLIDALGAVAIDTHVEPAFAAQALSLPSEHDVARKIGKEIDAERVHVACHGLVAALGTKLGTAGLDRVAALRESEAQLNDLEQAGVRSLRNTLLALLVSGGVEGAAQYAFEQHQSAETMTDRLAALAMLVRHHTDEDMTQTALAHFMRRHEDHALAIDKWFSVQSTIAGTRGLAAVQSLLDHPLFTLNNPNRARSVLGPFAMASLSAFHQSDGSGYALFADQILAMDAINPQVAARLATALNTWRNFNAQTANHAQSALERIAGTDGLSRDVQEIVDRCLSS